MRSLLFGAGLFVFLGLASAALRADETVYSGQLITTTAADGTTLTVREIHVVASDFHFDPSELVVAPGENVRLLVTAHEGHHGFSLKDFNINDKNIVPGREAAFEFVANLPGEHGIHCSHFCGLGHPGMSGTLTVK